jgi:undecaprenyl-diphosphatase
MLRYALLGVVQGLTEFLPVSSSGHLVLAERLLGVDPPGVLLEALLHWGTLAAVLVVFRRDVAALSRSLTRRGTIEHRKEVGLVLAGTVPIVVVGLLLRTRMDALFSSVAVTGVGLLATGGLLLLATRLQARTLRARVRFLDSVAIGIGQAAALLPGVSRSGTTIATGISVGLVPERAVRFSFLLAVPALSGAGLVSLWDAVARGTAGGYYWPGLLLGVAAAFLAGAAAIRVLLALVVRGRLWVFGLYCLALGISVVVRVSI